MSTSALEREAAQLREIIHEPTPKERAEARLIEVQDRLAAAERARTEAATWLDKNVLAIKKLYGQLDALCADVRKNLNERDIRTANTVWGYVCERLTWAFVVERRFPGITAPLPTLIAPGMRDAKAATLGLSIESWQRPFHPMIVAWWPVEVRARAFEAAAAEWIAGYTTALPEDLRAILRDAAPVSFEPPVDPAPGNQVRVSAGLAKAMRAAGELV